MRYSENIKRKLHLPRVLSYHYVNLRRIVADMAETISSCLPQERMP